ncbi:MAG: hypothetical protein ABIZ18_06630 [Caldimonas sp.]
MREQRRIEATAATRVDAYVERLRLPTADWVRCRTELTTIQAQSRGSTDEPVGLSEESDDAACLLERLEFQLGLDSVAGLVFLLISILGNWGYTYRAHPAQEERRGNGADHLATM